jgi:hypothetical protein
MLRAGCTPEEAEAIANDLQLLVDTGTIEDTNGTWDKEREMRRMNVQVLCPAGMALCGTACQDKADCTYINPLYNAKTAGAPFDYDPREDADSEIGWEGWEPPIEGEDYYLSL